MPALKDFGFDELFTLRWSPDAKTIACVGNHVEKGHGGPIVLVPVAGGKATSLVTDDDSWKYSLGWSPDGKWIAYDSQGTVKVRPQASLWEADFDEIVKRASR
ncbi:MAG: PD40 domain-containing protein [Phycisphaerales bacterium]|nr:MAG: PD40 domain-containing protein [Phycisphaerales bacterium]